MAYKWFFTSPFTSGFYNSAEVAAIAAAHAYFANSPLYGPFTSIDGLVGVPGTLFPDGYAQFSAGTLGTPKKENNFTGFGATVNVYRGAPSGDGYSAPASKGLTGFFYGSGAIEAAARAAASSYFGANGFGSVAGVGSPRPTSPGHWSVKATSTSGIPVIIEVIREGSEGLIYPSLTMPSRLPCWLAAGHDMQDEAVYADTAMRTGHGRKRRIYRSAPRTVSVGLALDAGQMRAFWEWFEGPLRAGAEPFAAHLPNQGAGLLWWHARFAEPPTYETLQKGLRDGTYGQRFRVRAKLILSGEGGTEEPVGGAYLESTATVALYGSAELTVAKLLASVSRVELLPALRLASTATIALLSGTDRELREDGGFELREDGGLELRG